MKDKIAIILLVFICIGCSHATSELPFENIEYIKTFPKTFVLENDSLVNTGKIGIRDIKICDTLMLISSVDSGGLISVFNTRSGHMSPSFIRQGNGPGEILYVPFFSNVNTIRKDNRTRIQLSDGKGGMIEWTLQDSSNNIPEVKTVETSLPQNSFCYIYISDTTYLCKDVSAEADRQIRYLMTNGQKRTTESLDKLNRLSIPVKRDGYLFNILSTFSGYSPKHDIVVEASIMLNMIHMYSLNRDFEKTICYGSKADNIDQICMAGMKGLKENFARLNLYDDFFAVMYSGKKEYSLSAKEPLPKILFFDWQGSPIMELQLKMPASVFDIDLYSKTLYTLDRKNEIIRKYDISKIMKEWNN